MMTSVGLLTGVGATMLGQCGQVSESLLAVDAQERTITGVCAEMGSKRRSLSEGLRARRALEGTISGGSAEMRQTARRLRESMWAELGLEIDGRHGRDDGVGTRRRGSPIYTAAVVQLSTLDAEAVLDATCRRYIGGGGG